MLKKLIPYFFQNTSSKSTSSLLDKKIYSAQHFNLSTTEISNGAIRVIKTLQQQGYNAYVVGGAIRDLILGEQPKDYDIATNATPEEVKKLFKRSRIIGRRFPIVHVYMGKELIEVSTFRQQSKRINNQGRITKDDNFGEIDSDAARRDFTCNALYFDPFNNHIVSYHQAIQHIQDHQLIMIGDIKTRIKEDPIRILRAIRIAKKLNFDIEETLLDALTEFAPLLINEPSSRLFDEWTKILFSKHVLDCYFFLNEKNILPYIHPITKTISEFENETDIELIKLTLQQTDERLKNNQSISIGFVLAAVLWPVVNVAWKQQLATGLKKSHALHIAILETMTQYKSDWDMTNKDIASINEIWRLQNQLENIKSKPALEKISKNPKFRSAFDFLLLRNKCGDVDLSKADWWIKLVKKNNPSSSIPVKTRQHKKYHEIKLKRNNNSQANS